MLAVGPAALWRTLILLAAGALVLAACGEESRESTERDTTGNVTPIHQADLPPAVEEIRVKVADGAFDVDTITLQEDEPSVVHVENEDGEAYRVQIVPDLVTPTDIPASATTEVRFTTPNPGRFDMELLPADGDEPLDSLEVIVLAPGGVSP